MSDIVWDSTNRTPYKLWRYAERSDPLYHRIGLFAGWPSEPGPFKTAAIG
jgi:hypothetical protein